MALHLKTIDKFIRLIEETSHRAYAYTTKGGRPKRIKKAERDLQESIIRYARSIGYRAINEDILRVKMPYHQPLMDVIVEIDGCLHAVELKIMNLERFRFFEGLDQALAYSLNGIDYSWLVHYLAEPLTTPIMTKWASPIERIFQTFGIKQIGYLLVDPLGLRCRLEPTEPIKHNGQNEELRQRIDRMLILTDSMHAIAVKDTANDE